MNGKRSDSGSNETPRTQDTDTHCGCGQHEDAHGDYVQHNSCGANHGLEAGVAAMAEACAVTVDYITLR
jgi:hypothetical protein